MATIINAFVTADSHDESDRKKSSFISCSMHSVTDTKAQNAKDLLRYWLASSISTMATEPNIMDSMVLSALEYPSSDRLNSAVAAK